MPLNQRKVIAEAIEGKRYVEWGVGGTTLWLTRHATPLDAFSIESDGVWFDRIEAEIPDTSHAWSTACVPCTAGQNATIGEEQSSDAKWYISAGASSIADVYLIDGVVRSNCLRALVATGRPMTVFIHDTQRDWYDDAIAEAIDAGFARTDYPEGDDYPGCLLTKLEKQ